MRKILLITLQVLCVLVACNKETGEAAHEEYTLVSFCPEGEITIAQTPLVKGSVSTNDLYLVQVYQGTTSFAFGYFDNLESMKLYLKKGYQYRIIVAMVKDAKTLLGERFNASEANGIINNYGYPDVFDIYLENPDYTDGRMTNISSFSRNYYFPINSYVYTYKKTIPYYYSSNNTFKFSSMTERYQRHALPNIETGVLNNISYPLCADWFYGEVNGYTPTGNYETMPLDFRRVGFRLKYELAGVTDGQVTVNISNSIRTFIDNTTTTETYSSEEQFIAFNDTHSAWQYASNGYTENLSVTVTWKRGIGVTQELGSKTVQVKRNCLNNIKILLGSDDRGAGMSFVAESNDLGEDVTAIPVQ